MIVHSKLIMRVTALAFTISAITGISGCGTDDAYITELKLKAYSEEDGEYSDKINKPIGIPQEIIAIGTFSDGADKEITNDVDWNVDDSINVSENGFFVGTELGHYDVNASYGDSILESNTIRLNISDAVLQSLNTELGSDQILKGNVSSNKALGYFSDQTKHDLTNYVTWIASNPEVAFATNSGVLGRSKGTAHISSSFDGVVSEPQKLDVVELDDIIISNRNPESISGNKIIEGTSTVLSAFGVYSNGYTVDLTEAVTWESSDLNTVTAHNLGLIKAISPGITSIIASHDNVSADEVEVEVVQAMPVSIDVSSSDTGTLYVGNTRAFTGSVTYDNGMVTNGSEIEWSSEDSSLEPIANTGVFLAAEPNSDAKVIASVEGQSGFFEVEVVEATIEDIEFRTTNGGDVISSISIPKTESAHVTAWGKYDNSDEYKNITNAGTWSTSASSIDVIGNGHITALNTTTNATVKFNHPDVSEKSLKVVVTTAPIISVAIERAEKVDITDLFPTETLKLKMLVTRQDGSNTYYSSTPSWSSSSSSLAEITTDGEITVKGTSGSLLITGTYEGFSANMRIPVNGVPICGGAPNVYLPIMAPDNCVPMIVTTNGKISGYPSVNTLKRMGYKNSSDNVGGNYVSSYNSVGTFTNYTAGQAYGHCRKIRDWNIGGDYNAWDLPSHTRLFELFTLAQDGERMHEKYNWPSARRTASTTMGVNSTTFKGILTRYNGPATDNYARAEGSLVACEADL